MEIIKHSKNLGTLTIKKINYQLAKNIIIQNHYSKKWNNSFGTLNFGIYKDDVIHGCAVFGQMMNPKSFKSISDDITQKDILELNRLWIDDTLGKNAETILISSCFKLIKANHPNIKLIQSFADGRLGCGTIYKASNFNYYGFNKSLFFENKLNGECFHKIPLENTGRPSGFLIKNRLYLDKKLTSFLVKTYRYIYKLDKRCKIKLKEFPYPIYEKGQENFNYTHSIGILTRLYLMYDEIKDIEYRDKCLKEILNSGHTMKSFEQEKSIQKTNKSYIYFLDVYLKTNRDKFQSNTNLFFN